MKMYNSVECLSNTSLDGEPSKIVECDIERVINNDTNNFLDGSEHESDLRSECEDNNKENTYIKPNKKLRHNKTYDYNNNNSLEFVLAYGPITKEELQMKWRLSYFFMNPYEKFLAKRRFPWKLVLQIIKLIILTYQLIDFGALRSLHINFMETSELSLKHLYLKDWSLAYETMPYPPSLGKMAVYTVDEFHNNVDFLLYRYNSTQDIAIGNFNYASDNDTTNSVRMCIRHYMIGDVWSFNETFVLNTKMISDCFQVHGVVDRRSLKEVFNIQQFLQDTNRTINFNGLIDISLSFSLRTIHLKYLHRSSEPDCYQFNVKVHYDNSGHNGQMAVVLSNEVDDLLCRGHIFFERGVDPEWVSSWMFNAFVLIVCILSSSLCLRSFGRAIILKKDTVNFFSTYYPEKKFDWRELLDFVDFWYMLITLNDFLSIMGCVYKILIQVKVSNAYELCGLLLGTGSLFAWFGVLRYLSLFKSFNILIVTVKLAVPNVLKFLVCAFFIFLGFSICGWIVLGPYHIKFRELTTSLECLYSLINGDDIFATFASMNKVGFSVWLFSRLYLYIFMSLFIYVVLSMFISIIADTYDSIKHPDSDMLMKCFLRRFAEDQVQSPPFDDPQQSSWTYLWLTLLKLFGYRKHRNNNDLVAQVETGDSDENTRLLLN